MLTCWFYHRTSYDRFFKHRHVSMFHLMVYNMEVLAIPIRDLHTNITPGSLLYVSFVPYIRHFIQCPNCLALQILDTVHQRVWERVLVYSEKIVRGWWSECEAEQCGWWQVYTLLGLSAVQSRVLICVCVICIRVYCSGIRHCTSFVFVLILVLTSCILLKGTFLCLDYSLRVELFSRET